jgi:hypothetical protein
VFPNR